jgi:hypothetical protein
LGPMTDARPPKDPGAWSKFVRYMTMTEDGSSRESRGWKAFRAVRWTAVLVVVIFAALSTRHEACQVITTVRAGLGTYSDLPRNETDQVCGTPGVSDLVGYFAIVVVLLLPDARSLKFGGIQFERLTTEVAKQSSEIGQLRQEVSTVANNTNNLSVQVSDVTRLAFADFRAYFRTQKAVLERIRSLLPGDPQTIAGLRRIDEFAARIDADDLNPFELIEVSQQMRILIAAKLTASGTEGDTVIGAEKAEDVLRSILGDDQPAS